MRAAAACRPACSPRCATTWPGWVSETWSRRSGRAASTLTPPPPIETYAYARRDDGLPVDAWLRVHVRAGARIVNVAHQSMVISGTLDSWREWTGLPFDVTGPVEVPLALSPVYCDVDQNQAVYVEPNVWVHHRID